MLKLTVRNMNKTKVVDKTEPVVTTDKTINHMDEKLDEIFSMIKKNTQPIDAVPPNFDKFILNNDQISDVLSELINLQEKYFNDIPLRQDLVKQFMWNIPKEVYDAYRDYIDYERHEALNPLLYFYIFCTEDVALTLPLFVKIINDIYEKDSKSIDEEADSYIEYESDISREDQDFGQEVKTKRDHEVINEESDKEIMEYLETICEDCDDNE